MERGNCMRPFWTLAFLMMSLTVVGQSGASTSDSLSSKILDNVLIQSLKINDDRLQNFYKASQSATTEDILCHMQSVYLIRRGAYGQEPIVRGLSGGQLSFTIDGMKMFGACTDKMDPVTIYIEPQNLDNISVTPGSSGSTFGSTVGGSVNMKLAEPVFSAALSGNAGVTYYSASKGWTAFTVINKSLSKSAFRFSSVYRNNQNYRAGGGDMVEYSQYKKLNLTLAGKWSLRAGDTLRADVLTDYGWNIGFPALTMDVGLAKTYMASITYSRQRPESFLPRLTVKGYGNSVYHEMDDTHRPDVAMHMDMPGRSMTTGLFAEGQLKKIGKHNIVFRADGYLNSSQAEMTMYPENEEPMYMETWPASSRLVTGLYGSDAFQVNSGTLLTTSARVDWAGTRVKEGIGLDQLRIFYPDFSDFQQQWAGTFTMALSQYFLRDFQFTVQGGYGQRLPTLSEYAGFYLYNRMDGYDYLGNPNLKTEKSWNENISLNYLSRKVELQMTVYAQQFQDYIFSKTDPSLIPMTPGANGVRVYENIEGAQYWGVETKFIYSISPSLQLIDQAKYVYATTSQNEPIPLIPPLTHQLSARYQVRSVNAQIDLEQSAEQNHINTAFGEDATPGYTIANVRFGWQVPLKSFTYVFQAGVENIFDKNYYAHLDWGNIPRPGRNIYFTLEVKF